MMPSLSSRRALVMPLKNYEDLADYFQDKAWCPFNSHFMA